MKQIITLKGFTQSEKFEKLLETHIDKLTKKLTNFVIDVPTLVVHIKKHDKNHFYSGLLTLTLPKKSLIAHSNAHSAEEVLIEGFEKIDKAFETYKGKHFKGSSKYPNHEALTIEDQ